MGKSLYKLHLYTVCVQSTLLLNKSPLTIENIPGPTGGVRTDTNTHKGRGKGGDETLLIKLWSELFDSSKKSSSAETQYFLRL